MNQFNNNPGLGEWRCQQCSETTSFKEILDSVFKLAVLGGIAYMAFNYKDQIKEAVKEASARLKK